MSGLSAKNFIKVDLPDPALPEIRRSRRRSRSQEANKGADLVVAGSALRLEVGVAR